MLARTLRYDPIKNKKLAIFHKVKNYSAG